MDPLDWCFPPRCVLCDAPGSMLCAACAIDATRGLAPACACCAIPLAGADSHTRCGRCLKRPPSFDRTLAGAIFEPPFDAVVRDLKYRSNLAFATLLGDLVVARANGLTIDRLIPVPLSRERIAARGFNQSAEIGRTIARRLHARLDLDLVLRIHDTPPQAALPFDARRKNIRGAFAVVDAGRCLLADATIGVVDDVMTTGATLDELAATLKRAGAARVINLVAARTP